MTKEEQARLTPALKKVQGKMQVTDPEFDIVDYILRCYNARGMSLQAICDSLPGMTLQTLYYGLGRLGYRAESKLRKVE